MEILSLEFLSALMVIIAIDLVLAGDNAILIGLASRNLPKEQQKKAILFGSLGAVVIRSVATIGVVWLLKIPGLHLVGGLMLVWIAYKLLVEEDNHEEVKAGDSFWAAIRTILIADALMGLDNVLAVAGASHGNFLLVIIGLLVSIPIVMWGSTIILKFIEKYPVIITIGAAILAWTASKMIVGEPFLKDYFSNGFLKYGFELLVVGLVVMLGIKNKPKNDVEQLEEEHEPLRKVGS
ncbi:TerC family protein [Peribacillus alkalitolerans]|uniref:TerC family protein n=1 Tax=Peribacillus alkalitolerans TaxID=1550385 RepID=UPI0013D3B126|nr:TerC family protein [Peribacillus alkalitolerans]